MILVTGSFFWDTVLILVGVCLSVYLYYQRKFTYWTDRGIPGPKPIPIFGNFLLPLLQKRSPGQFLWDLYKSVPDDKPVVGFYIFGRPALLLRHPNLVKHALVKDFNVFGDRHVSAYEKDSLGTQNLFVLKGAPWKYLRVKLSPTFTSGRMKKMFPLVTRCASNLMQYLQEVAPLGPVELKETTAKFGTDVISMCAFGIESNSLKDPKAEFREFGRKVFDFTRYRTFEVMGLFFIPSLVQLIKASFFTPSTTKFLRRVFWDTIQFREKNQIKHDDFLDLLIQLKNKEWRYKNEVWLIFQEVAPLGPVELKETTAKYATDVISICAFGIESNSLKDPKAEFREFGRKIFHFTRYRTLEVMGLFFIPTLVQLLKASFFTPTTTKFLRRVFWDTIQFREKNQIKRDDFLDLLIQLKNKGSVTELSGESPNESADIKAIGKIDDKSLFEFDGDNLLAQPAIFFTAGFETNATTVSFTLYELALQPELQTRLRHEIAGVLDKTGGKPTYEDVFNMKYLAMVVSETLRKYPPLPILDRVCLQDYKLPDMDLTLEKGTPIFVGLLGLHRDPKYFPDPERYDPERFSDEAKRTREPYTYLPFGEGPHNCIGMRFGLMAVKTGLFHILSQFEVQPCKETPIPLVLSTRSSVLASISGLPLKLIPSEATL